MLETSIEPTGLQESLEGLWMLPGGLLALVPGARLHGSNAGKPSEERGRGRGGAR